MSGRLGVPQTHWAFGVFSELPSQEGLAEGVCRCLNPGTNTLAREFYGTLDHSFSHWHTPPHTAVYTYLHRYTHIHTIPFLARVFPWHIHRVPPPTIGPISCVYRVRRSEFEFANAQVLPLTVNCVWRVQPNTHTHGVLVLFTNHTNHCPSNQVTSETGGDPRWLSRFRRWISSERKSQLIVALHLSLNRRHGGRWCFRCPQ